MLMKKILICEKEEVLLTALEFRLRKQGYEVEQAANGQEAIEKIKIETKRYAKRQMTWYRSNKGIHWFRHSQVNEVKELISTWLEV